MTTTTQENYDEDDDDHPKRDSSSSEQNHHLHLPPPSNQIQSDPYASLTIVKYRECMKNHAASMGSHIVDGCGEFMPNGEEDTPESLRCAACGCHRNFHRKETQGGVPVDSSGEGRQQPASMSKTTKKRFRTKFTQEQKRRMMEYAEKIGWKIQKNEEQQVRQFCSQVEVEMQVFKIWMHNNKQRTKLHQV
ncbi:hypothetical protein QN277_003168 [Acacia crassicarpa]|uniref:ZF-HD dimerization-type domain-containing protein n=1 Tax=Acacia crassicarpa TaxID=499986 RepID=A0AAE1MC51_9FABA|nr:hypothetical protein QN277_003168 [Acacia crassicarpa]